MMQAYKMLTVFDYLMEQEFQVYPPIDVLEDELQISDNERTLKVRLDKWLWAARFFKTRAVARAAIEKGKVFYNGERSKPSREIEIGAVLQIRQGQIEKTVRVKGLSTRRRNTEEALQLFEETQEKRWTDGRNSEWQPHVFSPSSFHARAEPAKERRVVRFLRRSFNREMPRQESRRFNPSIPEIEIGD